jgi:hypothetical protein
MTPRLRAWITADTRRLAADGCLPSEDEASGWVEREAESIGASIEWVSAGWAGVRFGLRRP